MKKKIMTNTIDTIGSNEIVEILKPRNNTDEDQAAIHSHIVTLRSNVSTGFHSMTTVFYPIDKLPITFDILPNIEKILRDDRYCGAIHRIDDRSFYGLFRYDHLYLLKLILDQDTRCFSETPDAMKNLCKWLQFYHGNRDEQALEIIHSIIRSYNQQLLTPH